MIVCSKRAFLNILTQLMDVNTLLNANYYIADQTTRNGLAQLADQISINSDGEYIIDSHVETTGMTLNPYHVLYGDDTLSPSTLMAKVMVERRNMSVEDMFKEQLMQKDNMLNVYRFLFKDTPKGNGLRILIYVNDSSMSLVHIVCEYIAYLFGENVTFIDKQYRNDIPGQVQYIGNKQKAMEVVQELRDYNMMKDILDLASNYQYGYQGSNNIEVYFNSYTVPQLFYIYEHLFPNEPLPIGNYTKEHIVHIIMRKIIHLFPQKSTVENLMIPSFVDMSALYNGISDDELMAIHE